MLTTIKVITIFVLVIIQITCLSGCADLAMGTWGSSFRTHEKNQGAIQFPPVAVFDNSRSVITLVREHEFAQGAVNYKIAQNYKIIGLLKPGSYMQWAVRPGTMTLSYKPVIVKTCYVNKGPCVTKIEDIFKRDTKHSPGKFSFKVEKGKHYYLKFVPDMTLFADVPGHATIKIVKAADLSGLKPPIYTKLQ
jgi:hypothetical protein